MNSKEYILESNLSPVLLNEKLTRLLSNSAFIIGFLILIKFIFQIIILKSGYRWLSADDYCRTVKSFEWMEHPVINSGVWLSPHFWINGAIMLIVKDLFTAAMSVNIFFSTLSVIYFYKLSEISFNKINAFYSTLIFCVFPFQVWLSVSGLPESVFFFFVIAGIYYFLKWREDTGLKKYLILSAAAFALSNLFRYEGWLFSICLLILVSLQAIKKRRISKDIIENIIISSLALITIIWWLVQNYFDHGNALFFADETTKIYESFSTAGLLQRLVQYPTFIFYIAPITTVLSFKSIIKIIKKKGFSPSKIFLLFNIIELILLTIQAILGTGGTNMISRYIVINALLFLPFAVCQILEFRKYIAYSLFAIIIIVNIIWCFYYPQPFREDTFEVGKLLRNQIENKDYLKSGSFIYFEEELGYFDNFAVQTLANNPSKFIFQDSILASILSNDKQQKKFEDINILKLKNHLEKNLIKLAVVRSDAHRDMLKKLSVNYEEVGDYKIFYLTNQKSGVNDSTISNFSKKVVNLSDNPEMLNFNQMIALTDYQVDNSNLGLNPQTVMVEWSATSKSILDSIDYNNFEFGRYKAVVEIRTIESDSSVYSMSNNIFSERSVEDLIETNKIRNIFVIKPFALLNYSRNLQAKPFESGVYNIKLKIKDAKYNNDLLIYKGFEPLKVLNDTISKQNVKDSIKIIKQEKKKNISNDSLLFAYKLGEIIAMFPNTDYDRLVKKSSTDVIRIIRDNGLKLLFSQRYQGDHFLDWVFNSYF